jgi:hypothetical protein
MRTNKRAAALRNLKQEMVLLERALARLEALLHARQAGAGQAGMRKRRTG